jgi:ABC-2 type transport system permease protein
MSSRIWSLVKKEFIHLINDWWLPLFMLLGGATELLLVGWATSRPITNLPLAVLDQDRSSASRAFIAQVENTGTFRTAEEASDLDEIHDELRRGDVTAAIVIPPDYADKLLDSQAQPEVAVLLNGAESIPATAGLRAIEGVVRAVGDELLLETLSVPEEELSGFVPRLRVWFNESLSEALYTTPAELGLMLEFTVLLFAALAFSRERELGTLEQLLVMPFSSMELIIGKSIPVVIIGFTDFLLMLGMVHFAFGVPVRGSLPLLLLLALIYLLVELCKGLVISVVSRSQHQAFLLVMMVGMADFMFTGYAAPVESMPKALQLAANLVPAHHWLEILRGILLKASGIEILWPHIVALIVLGLLVGGFSIRYVRRALD